MKKEFKEALGVPSGLVKTAQEIYNKILNIIPRNADFDDLNGFEENIRGEFVINEETFNEVEFEIELEPYNEFHLVGAATSENTKLTDKFQLKQKITNTFTIQFRYVGPESTNGEEIYQHMIDNKLEYVGTLAHELKHFYDGRKKPKQALKKRIDYVVSSNKSFANIDSVNEFIHYLYYSNVIESLVRPSEIAALLESGQINKKDFYTFLTSTRTYTRLNDMRNFSYEKLRNGIKDEMKKVKYIFDMNDIDYSDMSEDEIVETVLKLVHMNLLNWKHDVVMRYIVTNPLEALFGFTGEKEVFYKNYVRTLDKFDGNYKKFYEYEIKKMNYVGNKMIKKIAKLYDVATDLQKESIIDWQVWKLINENKRN
jgi:hypothetical protein